MPYGNGSQCQVLDEYICPALESGVNIDNYKVAEKGSQGNKNRNQSHWENVLGAYGNSIQLELFAIL